MAVITISRELGSGGTYIAEKLAQAMGYHFADKRTMEAILHQYGLVRFDDVYESVPGFWARFDALRAQTIEMLNRVIRALAQHGDVVIVGRGSYAVLAGYADVLNVRIQAPFPLRVQRVMEQEQFAELEKAEAFVRDSDRVRVSFVEQSYGIRWDVASAFDLMIDTGKIPLDLAVTWLTEAAKKLREREPGDQLTTASIQVDPTLAKAVSQALECPITH